MCPLCCVAVCACSNPASLGHELSPRSPPPLELAVQPQRDSHEQRERKAVSVRELPSGWVDLRSIAQLRFDIVYSRADNFTRQVVPGYGAPGAWLHGDAAQALTRAASSLKTEGYGVLVFDAYRPSRASEHFVEWAQASGRGDLVSDGYIAKRSAHNRGVAVDVGLFALDDGSPINMGSTFDTFDASAHFANAQAEAQAARVALRDAMQAQGFVPYSKEWWHFTYKGQHGRFVAPAAQDIAYSIRANAAR